MTDPYEARFTFFWYNDQEIFHDSERMIDAKVERMADQGITHLITFSCTHFRWGYRHWWKEINACLARIVKAAHGRGLKVIEHHSSELAPLPDTPERRERLRRYLLDHGSSLESWPGIVEMLNAPGSPARIWTQINEKTLQPNVTCYAATSKCFNNPDYRREYLEYLESVYATGVDGIMTDDVQYYCSCRCGHCTRLFKERYGYELPPPEKWDEWYGDMRDPSFIAWLRFRFDSTHSFHELVAGHYRRLGLELLRPNYLSLAITRDWTACSVETVPRMDWIFQECARSCVIRYSWPKVLSEQSHRAMVARNRGIPHGILFYAYDRDQLVFSWGLAMLAGAFYINTPEGRNSGEVDETRIRDFERRHARNLFHADPLPEVGFLDSRANRFLAPGYEMSRMEFWLQACRMHNIPCALVSVENPESWKGCSILCLNELNLLTGRQIRELRRFAEDGGVLMFSGVPGNQDGDCRERPRPECEELWGIPLDPPPGRQRRIHAVGRGRICVVGTAFGYPGTEEEIQAVFGTNHLDFRFGRMPFHLLKSIGFVCANTIRTENRPFPSDVKELQEGFLHQGREVAALLRRLLPEEGFRARLPAMVLAAPFLSRDGARIGIRLLNAAGTLTPPGDGAAVSHDDPIPWKGWDGPPGHLAIGLPAGMEKAARASCHTLDGQAIALPCRNSGRRLEIDLPPGVPRDFALVVVA